MNRLEKKTTATLLIAIFMISAFAVAMPVSAVYIGDDYTVAVLKAADRLVANQEDDGGFDWVLEDQSEGSTTNTLGITAIGILKAHEILDKAEYETALAKAYKYAYGEATCYRFPDVTFLVLLAEACSDASLLAAIDAEVTGTTVQDILNLAVARWTDRLVLLGAGSPTVMAEYLLANRGWGVLAFWDLGAAVKAALALEPHFTGHRAHAEDIADVMYDNLQVEGVYYFNIEDTGIQSYTLALSGSIEAFSELGVYPTMARTMTDQLIAFQDDTNYYWDEVGDGEIWGESVQSTAYAVMALIEQGDADAIVAAQKAGLWLEYMQNPNGGWNPIETEYAVENLEVDSEAAWALFNLIEPSQSFSMTAGVRPPVISITVTPTSFDFGTIISGRSSAEIPVTVTNTGEVDVTITADIEEQFYRDCLFIVGKGKASWDNLGTITWDETNFKIYNLQLVVPQYYAVGSYEGILVFEATPSPPPPSPP